MPELLIRITIILCLSLLATCVVWLGKRFVARRKQQVLTATSVPHLPTSNSDQPQTPVSILAFSSTDCRQCHQLQEPALRRLVEKYQEPITVVHIDAPSSPDLTQHYQVLTVPTTVVLDQAGKAHAINYGFTNTQRLQEQVNQVLALAKV